MLELERYTKDSSRLGGDMKLTREIYELDYRKKWLEQRQKEKKKRVQDQARKWVTYTEGEEERVEALKLKRKALGV